MVCKVEPGPAGRAGIRRGGVILIVNNEKIKNTKQFERLLSDLPKEKSISILVQCRDAPTFLALKLSGDENE